MDQERTRVWRGSPPLETILLAGFLWVCALPLITTLVLPRLGPLVAVVSALAALGAATWAAAALTGQALGHRSSQPADELHEDHRTLTR